MKFAAITFISFILIAIFFIRFFAKGEDSAGPIALGICVILLFGIVALVTAILQKVFQDAVNLKTRKR